MLEILRSYNTGTNYPTCAAASAHFQAQKSRRRQGNLMPATAFCVGRDKTIPRLAWICEAQDGQYAFTIGPGVDSGDAFIVEGVWDGPFAERGFAASDHFYGSGALVDGRGVVFAPPRLCTDYLYVLQDKQAHKAYVSNSFCFIFKRAGIRPEGEFFARFRGCLHATTAAESRLGADRGSPLICEDASLAMFRMMYHNFRIAEDGGIRHDMRVPLDPGASDFSAYRAYLLAKVAALTVNGAAAERNTPALPITMISTGYDSSAVSAVCAQAGVRDAITLDVTTTGHYDCGAEIAASLGLNCIRVESPGGRVVPDLNIRLPRDVAGIHEFLASPGLGDNVVFANMEPYLSGRIVFSGLYGDGCWAREGNGSGLAHHLPYMKSRNEFRLRVGYSLAPMPAFGAYFPCMLQQIGAHPSMKPYALGGFYDRPIARRLAEEAGVPRELFGQRKAANNFNILNHMDFFTKAVETVMERYR